MGKSYILSWKKYVDKRNGGLILNKNCDIVRDLIPLVADNIASEESKKFVENHCETCEECKKELWIARQDITTEKSETVVTEVWESIEKKQRKKKVKKAVEIFIIGILVITVGILGVVCFNNSKESNPNNYVRTSLMEGLKTEYNKGYTEKDKLTVQPIMKQVDEALHYVGGENSAIKKFDKLYTFCTIKEPKTKVSDYKLDVKIELKSIKLYDDMGYIWFDYSRSMTCKSNHTYDSEGASKIPTRLIIAKNVSDQWTVITKEEMP